MCDCVQPCNPWVRFVSQKTILFSAKSNLALQENHSKISEIFNQFNCKRESLVAWNIGQKIFIQKANTIVLNIKTNDDSRAKLLFRLIVQLTLQLLIGFCEVNFVQKTCFLAIRQEFIKQPLQVLHSKSSLFDQQSISSNSTKEKRLAIRSSTKVISWFVSCSWVKQRFFQISVLVQEIMNHQSYAVGKYSCSQLFGYKGKSQKIIEEDNLTTLKFDHTGRYLALGDKAGRLIVFQTDSDLRQQQEYQYYFEFQAQSSQFDTLKNQTLSQEVLYIDWLKPQGKYLKVLTANSHTVNLWKIYEKNDKKLTRGASKGLMMPKLQAQQPTLSINAQSKYQNKCFSSLNTVQVSKNEQFIFTADQRCLYLWNMQKSSKAFVQRQLKIEAQNKFLKPEKITCASMSSERESLQVMSTNRGKISVVDSRLSFNTPTVRDFTYARDSKSFLSQITNQYSAVKFIQNDIKIVTRDVVSVKIWDMRNSREPFLNVAVDQTIQNYVCDLFEAEVLQDRFKISEVKGNILTGNYGNSFQLIDPTTGQNVQYQLDYGQKTRARKVGVGQRLNQFSCEAKVLAHDYNLSTGQLAVTTRNCFFIFSQENDKQRSGL